MSPVTIRRHRPVRPARFAIRKRRPAVHPLACTCRACRRPAPSDRRPAATPSVPAMILVGLLAGLLLIATLAGPKAALLAATGIAWGGR